MLKAPGSLSHYPDVAVETQRFSGVLLGDVRMHALATLQNLLFEVLDSCLDRFVDGVDVVHMPVALIEDGVDDPE